jgi:hypothetical protein
MKKTGGRKSRETVSLISGCYKELEYEKVWRCSSCSLPLCRSDCPQLVNHRWIFNTQRIQYVRLWSIRWYIGTLKFTRINWLEYEKVWRSSSCSLPLCRSDCPQLGNHRWIFNTQRIQWVRLWSSILYIGVLKLTRINWLENEKV